LAIGSGSLTVVCGVSSPPFFLRTLAGSYRVEVYFLFGSMAAASYLLTDVELFLLSLTSSVTTSLIDLTIVENKLKEEMLQFQAIDTTN
jgi:hypothetical protein